MNTIKNAIVHFTDGSTFECKTFERGTWKSSCDGIWVDNTKIAKVELVDSPFEKTPKMSIKRYLYH